MGPFLRSLTAERRGGYQDEEVEARVGKSRMYTRRGRGLFGREAASSTLEGVLTRASKKTLTLLGGAVRREGDASIARLWTDVDGARRAREILEGMKETSGLSSSSCWLLEDEGLDEDVEYEGK